MLPVGRSTTTPIATSTKSTYLSSQRERHNQYTLQAHLWPEASTTMAENPTSLTVSPVPEEDQNDGDTAPSAALTTTP